MKLNKHQTEIVLKILDNEVYDIVSYTKCFNKYHVEKRDINELEKTFKETENGKKYKVLKEGHSRYTTAYTQGNLLGATYSMPNIVKRTDITDEECEYKEAKFNPNIKPIEYEFGSDKFAYDFSNEDTIVFNDFNDIIDFLTLWNHLKQEALILEVDKPITKNEVGLFFEPYQLEKERKDTNTSAIEIKKYFNDENISKFIDKLNEDIYDRVPVHNAVEYETISWKINEENMTMSKDFIGKKIIPTSSLYVYSKHGFKTTEQRSQRKNLIVAWVAVIISVISVILGNIIPLIQSSSTEYLQKINEKIIIIEKQINKLPTNEIIEIKSLLNDIKQNISELKNE